MVGMLAATVRLVQVLDTLEVRAVITVFAPGMDPESFSTSGYTVKLDDELMSADPLTITASVLGLWSEMTIQG